MALPKDPFMLLSVINTKLRDYYSSLDELCEDMNESKSEIEQILANAGFEYNSELNKFF
jgi:HPt (histidine-containing phosphotransfer) domain-containing protein